MIKAHASRALVNPQIAPTPFRRCVVTSILLFHAFTAHPAAAQSFDCAKATLPTEKLICGNKILGQLDQDLAAAFKRLLSQIPNFRDQSLAAQRHWIEQRDLDCQAKNTAGCLEKSYRNRLAIIERALQAGPPDKALCQHAVDVYRSILKSHPEAVKIKHKSQFLSSPIDVIFAASAGFSKTNNLAEFPDPTPSAITQWAHSQVESFSFPPDLLETIAADQSGPMMIDKVPGANFYVAYSIQGTAHCYYGNFFTVADGHATSASPPPGWADDEGGACGADRSFGTIDGAPVAFDTDENAYAASINPSMTIIPWKTDHFAPACTVEFNFSPAFYANRDHEDNKCDNQQCEHQLQLVLPLVANVQENPLKALSASLSQLTPQQRSEYAQIGIDFPSEVKPADDLRSPEVLQDTAPMFVPLLFKGKVCQASLGHTTFGWRTSPEWTVKTACPDNRSLSENTFTISMGRGRFENATVK